MKVAVLDLGTVFAKLFKPPAAAASSSSPPKSLLLLPPSPCPSLPARRGSAALAPAGGSFGARTLPGVGSGAKPAAGNPSPRAMAPPGSRETAAVWAASLAGKAPLFLPLPDIGEEGAPDGDPQEEAAALGRGLSRGSAAHGLQGKSEYPLPAPFTKSVQAAIDNYEFVSVSSLSSNGQITPTDLDCSWSGIQSYTTGPSTERSSIYSWRDDEFDKANTQRVHDLFWEADEILFEGKVSSQSESLKTECKDWTNRSLHLRILGKQLILPNDEGFQHYQRRNANSLPSRSLPGLREMTSSMKELCISGSKLIPAASPVHKAFSADLPGIPGADSSAYSFLEEEIYDAEGEMEEYLAFDKRELDDESSEQKKFQLAKKRSKRGIPPVSPNACIKDAVTAEIFDDAWKSVIGVLEELIRKNWESAIAENDKQLAKLKTIGNKLPHLPVSRVTVETSSVPPSRGSEARGSLSGLHFVPSQLHRFPSNLYSDLNGVMTIQAKPLQRRHSGLPEKIQNEQDCKPQPVGPSVNSARSRLGRITDSSVLSSSRMLQGSSRKMLGHRRLPSIIPEPLRAKNPHVYSDEVLRGTKLCTTLDHVTSPLLPTIRNKLPPINTEVVDQYLSVPGSQHGFHKGRHPHSRISSAVPNASERRPLRERTVVTDQFSRPSTTHTFRSDAAHKRSLNSMDFANHMWTHQGVLTGSQFHVKSFQRNSSVSKRRFQVTS